MGALMDFDPLQEDADLVYQILKADGKPKKFRDLVQQVFAIKNISSDNHQLMANIHTQIILDSRFVSLGQSTWGLKEWKKDKVVRREYDPTDLLAPRTPRRRSLEDEIELEEGDFQDLDDIASFDDEDWDEE
ncbi:MAG: DNA-directed RNA polymerase subunit delta [Peptococcia bacterium]